VLGVARTVGALGEERKLGDEVETLGEERNCGAAATLGEERNDGCDGCEKLGRDCGCTLGCERNDDDGCDGCEKLGDGDDCETLGAERYCGGGEAP